MTDFAEEMRRLAREDAPATTSPLTEAQLGIGDFATVSWKTRGPVGVVVESIMGLVTDVTNVSVTIDGRDGTATVQAGDIHAVHVEQRGKNPFMSL